MRNNKKWLAAWVAGALICGNLSAQETDFDLSSQRSEAQNILPVPGKKTDHQGIVISPTPHQITLDRGNLLDITPGFALKDKQKKFANDLQFTRLASNGVKLTIDFGEKAARKKNVKAISGAYHLDIGKKGISITGYDEQGAFYGIQTLRQLLESPACKNGKLPYALINDYPDLPWRGVVEGFYGTPWSHKVRLSLIDFYGKFKMNTYLYGPKDDPYHSCPNWRLPYPEEEARNIKELVDNCRRNRVNFVWAIHPGQDIKWNEEDYQNLINKFNWMYDLGVRSFAIFFDDISGEGTNPEKQTDLLNRLDKDFVKAKGDVTPLTVCPTDYSKLWANPTPQGSLAIYGKTLDSSTNVFWTGDAVCSDLTKETMEWLNTRIKRPGYYWWNFPVTDYARHIIMQGPAYGLDTSLTNQDLCGIVSNPMEHGEASKLALYGVADYAWNVAAYNPMDSWERGLAELMPEATEAYRTFAIHSTDTEIGYRRDESWETKTFRLKDYTDEQADALLTEFKKAAEAPAEIEKGCANKQLANELRPWLEEFGKLAVRGERALELMKLYRSGEDNAAFWNKYTQNLMSADARKAYNAHKSGTMKLQPFYECAMNDMGDGFLEKILGQKPMLHKGISSFANSATALTRLMFDNDSTTYYSSASGQKAGDWIGVDLGSVRDVNEVSILQGRNSVNDVDYFDHAVLECSANGRQWTALIPDMKQQYVIAWKGDTVKARYVRIRRLDSGRRNYASVRSFEVNPPRLENIGFSIRAAQPEQVLYAFDKCLDTSFKNKDTFAFGIPEGTKSYTLLMNQLPGKITLKQLKADGSVLAETSISTAFAHISLVPEATMIQIEGQAEFFEIIPKS